MLEYRIVEGVEGFRKLESAWSGLADSIATCRLTQTFDWCRLAWEAIEDKSRRQLICAVAWRVDRLVAIWPFSVETNGSVTWVAPMGCAMKEEYGDPLIAGDIDREQVCANLLKLVRNFGDVLTVYSTLQGTPIQRLLSQMGIFNIPRPMEAYSVRKTSTQPFNEFLNSYSANFRKNLRQSRNRIQRVGILQFELLDDVRRSVETIDWILAEKREWVQRQQKKTLWLDLGETRTFFITASMFRSDVGRFGLFRLTLDSKPVAAIIATIDRTRIEAFMASFDPEYSRFSPGMLLIEDVVRWGYDRGLTFDMRPLWLDYKERWANTTTPVISYRVPLSLKGAICLFPTYADFMFKSIIRFALTPEQRNAVKRWTSVVCRRATQHPTGVIDAGQ